MRAGARNKSFGDSDRIEWFQILIFFPKHSRQFYFCRYRNVMNDNVIKQLFFNDKRVLISKK